MVHHCSPPLLATAAHVVVAFAFCATHLRTAVLHAWQIFRAELRVDPCSLALSAWRPPLPNGARSSGVFGGGAGVSGGGRHCHGYRVCEWEARVVMIHVDWISGWDAWSSGGEGGREGREREGGDEEDGGGVEEVLGARWDEVEPRWAHFSAALLLSEASLSLYTIRSSSFLPGPSLLLLPFPPRPLIFLLLLFPLSPTLITLNFSTRLRFAPAVHVNSSAAAPYLPTWPGADDKDKMGLDSISDPEEVADRNDPGLDHGDVLISSRIQVMCWVQSAHNRRRYSRTARDDAMSDGSLGAER
ncbi:hypothetical protein B0H14DRAFT_3124206 [Mycena olivaceomarginata]|nr:hypothetical protein B0H14DRAFT_3124206 [Mycena olivaceomarginata]